MNDINSTRISALEKRVSEIEKLMVLFDINNNLQENNNDHKITTQGGFLQLLQELKSNVNVSTFNSYEVKDKDFIFYNSVAGFYCSNYFSIICCLTTFNHYTFAIFTDDNGKLKKDFNL
jgi:hypothetical protein